MQPLNNDMEELFREAADKYPLKTEGADWSKVQRGLQAAAKEEDAFRRKGGSRRYAWFLLLLLLAPLICNRLTTGPSSGNRTTADKTSVQTASSIPVKRGAATDPSALKPNITINNKVNSEPDHTIVSYSDRSPLSGGSTAAPYTKPTSSYKIQLIDNRILKPGLNYRQRELAGKNKPSAGNKKSMLSQQNSANGVITDGVGTIYSADNSNLQKNILVDSEAKETDRRAIVEPDPLQVPVNESVDSVTTHIQEQPVITDSVSATALKNRRKKIYVTVLAGPDFSAVKSSRIQGMKGSVGIVAGYSFTRKFSVEAGMLWDDKKYASKGKYFNIDNANLPLHTTVLDVSGSCHIIEVPLTIRYNFAAARSHSWTVSTGLSSYFMKKETYDYWYVRYNNKYYAEKEYKNSGSDWFSMLQASAGYQKALGRSATLRIEPYLKVPLKGIGIGRIPLLSAGMYVGLTLPVH